MGVIKINNIVYGSNNSADIIYKNTTVEEKLDSIPVFDPSDNANIEANQYDYLTYGHIVDALNSLDTSKALSANQGRVLSKKIDNINLSYLEDGIAVNAENISNLDSDIELLNNSLNNEYISDCDVFEEIEKEVVKRGNMSTFCLSFGGGLTNAPTSDWIWFSVIYKNARIIAFNKDSIAILHRNNGIYDGWKIINPTDINNLNNKVPFSFGVDANGNYGYIKDGADTVTPFNNLSKVDLLYEYTGRSGTGVNASYKACGYTLTDAQCKKYSYYIYSMVTQGCNCISYSGISTVSMPSGSIKLYDQSGNLAGGAVSGSNGQMDYRNILYLTPRQSSPVTFTASGRGGLVVKLFGIYGN